ncbi:hypothetical protein EPA93_41180 [Ktedonosporobacter rubrisoli]|uniref:Twin-arginine translocase TatA/TatE family subunit n=1 Tax=Ktedonosporobacter rubrisoli TaxID=2509675 RepID=A0A4P6K1S1_KTERU|nr:twin-arginine translocase TatA/TatE family subunit [Ktedonosporobacter rubrisoli]QBD82054.1 hypothetical protein EPA93_41180 [Ktedonosporobacter rubrisoli]
MGFHFVDILIIAFIGLAIFGPKALQSMAHSAGKGVNQAKNMKDKLMAELPMDEISQVAESIPQVPLNSQQAVQMLLTSSNTPAEKSAEKKQQTSETPLEKKQEVRAAE